MTKQKTQMPTAAQTAAAIKHYAKVREADARAREAAARGELPPAPNPRSLAIERRRYRLI